MSTQETFAGHRPTRRKKCGCGADVTVQVILQARSTSRVGSLATRARSLCRDCAERVYAAMEQVLDGG